MYKKKVCHSPNQKKIPICDLLLLLRPNDTNVDVRKQKEGQTVFLHNVFVLMKILQSPEKLHISLNMLIEEELLSYL